MQRLGDFAAGLLRAASAAPDVPFCVAAMVLPSSFWRVVQ